MIFVGHCPFSRSRYGGSPLDRILKALAKKYPVVVVNEDFSSKRCPICVEKKHPQMTKKGGVLDAIRRYFPDGETVWVQENGAPGHGGMPIGLRMGFINPQNSISS